MTIELTSDPTRSCVGCREKDARDALLRFVAVGAPPVGVMADVRRREGGRGVSVHPRRRCLEAAVRNGALQRAFKGAGGLSAPELTASALGQYERRAQGLVIAARRSRNLAVGTEAVRDSIAAHKAKLLVVAHDAEGSRGDLEEAARRLGRDCLVWNTKQGLGRLFSRTTLSVLAVLDNGIADELRSVVRSAAELAEDA